MTEQWTVKKWIITSDTNQHFVDKVFIQIKVCVETFGLNFIAQSIILMIIIIIMGRNLW